jgi:multiple sugar transport system permease protein
MATLWRLSLNSDAGPLAAVVRALGISENLLGAQSAVPTLIAVDALHWSPMVMLLVYAGLQGIPQELYEAARVDGAGYWKTLGLVTAPIMVPTLAIAVFLRLIDGLKTFDTIYVLTGGGPGTQTTNINVYVYRLAFTNGDFGQAAATGLMFLIVLLAITPLVTRMLVPSRTGAAK